MKENNMSWRKVYAYNKRALLLWWKLYPPVLISSVLSAAMEVAVPYVTVWFSARIIQELAGGQDREALISLAAAFLVTELLLGGIKAAIAKWYEITSWLVYCGNNVVEQHFNEKLYDLDFADMDSNETWDLYARISQNDNWGWWGMRKELSVFYQLVKAVLGIGGGIALTWQLFTQKIPVSAGRLVLLDHPVFLIGFILFLIGMAVLSPVIRMKVTEWEVEHADQARFGNRLWIYGGFLGFHRENTPDMRIYRQDQYCKEILNNPAYDMFGIHSAFAKMARGKGGIFQMAADAAGRLFTAAVYLFVCLKSWAGAFGVGAVTQYISAVTLLYTNVVQFLDCVGELRNNADFLETTFAFLDIPNRMYRGSLTTEKRTDGKYEVEFRHVSFRYPGSREYVLKDVSMKFMVGQKLAIVGENGSGKTTFIKLLCRLYDPDEGQILLNGIDIRKYDYREYMSIFSVVFQDFKLLSFMLGENVAAGTFYDEKKVWECLEKAGLKERTEQMEQGLSTYLYKDFDDSGVEISGGEAQKLAIARALYREAAFLILDEPTAALDPLAEYEIYSKFNEIAGEKTAIYISHRLSSCRFCDEILVFERGQIVQQGSHEQLLAEQSGKYYALWNAQAQYYVNR